MASDLPFSWLRQAESDFRSAERLVGAESACQAIAKYQQVVEKSVKAISEAFFDRRVFSTPVRSGHDVDRLVAVILAIRHRRSNRNWGLQFKSLFNESRRDEIRTISGLVPQKAAVGQLEAKNTEYPYQNADGTWRAPADAGSFDRADIDRFRRLANAIGDGAHRMISLMYRSDK